MSRVLYLLLSLCFITGACDKTETPVTVPPDIPDSVTPDDPSYVGKEACATCHEKEMELYTDSHHDLAMQIAGPDSVLGDFDNTDFEYNGIISTFFRKEDKYYVRTDGPSGILETYQIKYTFGVQPLQQYLIEFSGGRLQALGIAWDSRSRQNGGQRWFHLYPGEQIDYRDALHWTGINQNWNNMCAECHSTDIQKNYDPDTRSYATRWAEIDVSCETCHGPGSIHVQLAQDLTPQEVSKIPAGGLSVDISSTFSRQWIFREGQAIASLAQSGTNDRSGKLIDMCGRCHARRTTIDMNNVFRKSLHDTHIISLLEAGLYQDDGQINDEVYVYGSFVQSRMFQAGVNCDDCHDPHSLRLKREGNDVCLQCHRGEVYDSGEHHFHKPDSSASRCVACHMPAKNFMVIDTRLDHSLRIPRPDLSIRIGTPNACNLCHEDQSPEWALNAISNWYKKPAAGFHYGEAFQAARTGRPGAGRQLLQVINDATLPSIVRATALSSLAAYPNTDNLDTVRQTIASPAPLIRRASLSLLTTLDPRERYRTGSLLLEDPVKSVRIEAARVLAGMVNTRLAQSESGNLHTAINEYIEAQTVNSDRGFAHTNLGNLFSDMQEYDKAEQAYRTALEIEPGFVPAWINLADLYRRINREPEAESVLRSALRTNDSSALLYHALGLSLIRQKKYPDGIRNLERAARTDPDHPQFTLFYAIALNSTGDSRKAIQELEDYNGRSPFNRAVLTTLATINRDTGDIDAALNYARRLVELAPEDSQSIRLLESLEEKAGEKH